MRVEVRSDWVVKWRETYIFFILLRVISLANYLSSSCDLANETRKDRDLKQVGPGSYGFTLADKKKEPAFR